MKKIRLFAWLTLAAGIAAAGTTTLSAQVWHGDRTLSAGYHHEYSRVSQLRAEIARDQAQLNRDRRHGNRLAAERDLRELSRDQRELNLLLHNGHSDWR